MVPVSAVEAGVGGAAAVTERGGEGNRLATANTPRAMMIIIFGKLQAVAGL
jgi:hypothetical protein